LTTDLGEDWRFPAFQMFKPYAHCRVMHAPMDLLIALIAQHDIQAADIENITVYGEGWAYALACFINRDILLQHDAQFCFVHGLAVAAHGIPPGKQWQDAAVVFDPSVMALMHKVQLKTHPSYFESVATDILSRPTRVEIRARGQTFAAEKRFPKGMRSSDPQTYMTNDELAAKFRTFVDGILPAATADQVVGVMNLEKVADFGVILRMLVRQ